MSDKMLCNDCGERPKYDDGVCKDCWKSYLPSCDVSTSTESRQPENTCTICGNELEDSGLCYECEIELYGCKAPNCCTITEEYLRAHHEGLCQRHYGEKYGFK